MLAPLFALLLGSHPPARAFWTEFSVAIGYSGLAIMGLQFGLTARFRYVTDPWGEDVIYHFHRQISLVAVVLVIAHPVILFIIRPELLALLNSFTAPWRARFAALSTYSLIALVVMAMWRTKLQAQLRDVAPHAHPARGRRRRWRASCTWWAGASTSVDPWKRGLWIGLTIFWIGLLLYVRLIKPLFVLRRPYRISEVRKERGDTWTMVMQPRRPPRLSLPPGPVRLADGVGEPVQDHRAPVLVLVERGGDGRPRRDVDPQARRLHQQD